MNTQKIVKEHDDLKALLTEYKRKGLISELDVRIMGRDMTNTVPYAWRDDEMYLLGVLCEHLSVTAGVKPGLVRSVIYGAFDAALEELAAQGRVLITDVSERAAPGPWWVTEYNWTDIRLWGAAFQGRLNRAYWGKRAIDIAVRVR